MRDWGLRRNLSNDQCQPWVNHPETFEEQYEDHNHDQVILLLQLRVLSKEFV